MTRPALRLHAGVTDAQSPRLTISRAEDGALQVDVGGLFGVLESAVARWARRWVAAWLLVLLALLAAGWALWRYNEARGERIVVENLLGESQAREQCWRMLALRGRVDPLSADRQAAECVRAEIARKRGR